MEQPLIVPEGQSPAVTAGKLFAEVSGRYPASVSVQAAAAALRCHNTNLQMQDLGKELLADDQQVEYLRVLARNAHRHMDLQVEEAHFHTVAERVFTLGQAMQSGWSQTQMQEIIDRYPEVQRDSFASRLLNYAVCVKLGLREP